jgi:hypothetical protein
MSTNTTTAPTTRDALANQLESEGYIIGKPTHVHADCIAIDRGTATETTCDECGHHGLEFLPFRLKDRGKRGYRCMAWCCCCCDEAFEL